MQKTLYLLHRWVSLLVGLQLFVWCLGGLVFATHAIDWVHGDRTRRTAGHAQEHVALERVRVGAVEAARAAGLGHVAGARLRTLAGAPVWELEGRDGPVVVDAEAGKVLTPLGREAAVALARADQREGAEVAHVARLERDPPSEYREKPLPAWVVTFADGEGTRVYVSERSGLVTARRNDAWRRFDFFWMLHTMDYGGRDDFNTPWLTGFAAIGVLSALTGLVLWAQRLSRRLRRGRVRPAAHG